MGTYSLNHPGRALSENFMDTSNSVKQDVQCVSKIVLVEADTAANSVSYQTVELECGSK